MFSSYLFTAGGSLVGLVLFAAGFLIGYWLRRRKANIAAREQVGLAQARDIASRVHELADQVNSCVDEHRAHLDQVRQSLSPENIASESALVDVVVEAVGEFVRANQCLESRLNAAESRLELQALELETHVSRSSTDALTGLSTRRVFDDLLRARYHAWEADRAAFSLLLLDIDGFKKINDYHGHLVGDDVLRKIGHSLRSVIRRNDVAARYGGEEFAVVLPQLRLEQARVAVNRLMSTLGHIELKLEGEKLVVTLSGGLATILPSEDTRSLMRRADEALYAAKAAGRDCAFLHDGKTCQSIDRPLSAEALRLGNEPDQADSVTPDIRQAGTNGELVESKASAGELHTFSTELANVCGQLRQSLEKLSQGSQLPL